MRVRHRTAVAVTDRRCSLCGVGTLTLVESRELRRGLARLRPRWDPHVHRYELCDTCQAKHPIEAD